MKKLKKGDKVIITCSDTREKSYPKNATVVTSGRKWITVKFDGSDYVFPYFFDATGYEFRSCLYGGNKDGSYTIFELYDSDIVNMENIFENAKFGDRFKTRDGRMAVYRVCSQNLCFEHANFLIVDKEPIEYAFRDNGLNIGNKHEIDIVSRWKEPIDEEKLDKLIDEEIVTRYKYSPALLSEVVVAFRKGYRKAKEE